MWMMNEIRQLKNLLFGLREKGRGVLYMNENITNTKNIHIDAQHCTVLMFFFS